MPQHTTRHRSADVAVGYAAHADGHGIAYAAVATGSGRGVVRVPFATPRLPGLDGREAGYAAVGAVAAYLRGRGFTRIRLRIGDENVVDDLTGRRAVPPALAISYVKVRCTLHGFAVARVERAEPVETHELHARARADIAPRTPAAA